MLTLREEILNLLESPELLEYLLSNPERLCEFDYANIIAGAPIGLAEKRALLEKLKNSAELRREPDKVADYIAALDFATAALENSGNETVMSVVLRRCGVDSFVDGRIGHGALKHGNYISESACGIKQYLSPLYRARICVEELPESCRFMKSLRVKLRSDPDFGKAISQVGSYLKFRQS